MGLPDQRRRCIISYHRLDCIILPAGSYRIVSWIVSYRIVSIGSYRIGWIVSGNNGFYALDDYWLDEIDGTDGLDGSLVGRGWDGQTLAAAGMGETPLAPEQERHHCLLSGGGMWEVVDGTNYVGAARTRIIFVGEAK